MFRPEAASSGEYRVVYRFDTREYLQAWLDSDERAVWLERAEPHVIGPMRTQVLTGLETWFTLPAAPAFATASVQDGRTHLDRHFPADHARGNSARSGAREASLVPRLAITTAVAVPIMTWIVMPRVTRLLRGWPYPGS